MLGIRTFALATAVAMPAAAYAQDKSAAIDRIFSFATPETPGCGVGVAQHGKVLVDRTYGLASVEQKRMLTPNAKFDIGSTQKQFTAAAMLVLVQDGRVSLSDDIHKYLPELPDYGHAVTIEHLLTHTAGIRDWTALQPLAEDGIDVLELVMRQRGLNFTPGDEWSYSSSGYELAKEIVARASGMSFAEFTRRRLFEPLGMRATEYVPDILQGSGERAIGYQKDGNGWKQFMRLGANRGGGALITTAGDLLRWNDALTNARLGKLVSAKLAEPAKLNNGRTIGYGRGLMIDSIPGGPLLSHNGGAAGFSSWLGRFPEHELSIAVICNFDPVSATALGERVADLYLPPVDRTAAPKAPVAASGVDVSAREGLYLEDGTGEPLRLVVNGGRLSIAGGAPPLVPVSAERFVPSRATLFFRSQDAYELTFRSKDDFDITSMEGKVTHYRRAQPMRLTRADLQPFDGRYRSDELGQVFEVLPGERGVIMRFESAPERTLEALPIAREVFMMGQVYVRFRRDASGAITGFEYLNPVARHIVFTRIGDRVSRVASAPAADTPKPEGLVGTYEMAPGRFVVVTVEDGQLYGQPTGNTKRPLVHVSGATFGVGQANAPITLTFSIGADGRAESAVMRQGSAERTLRRVP